MKCKRCNRPIRNEKSIIREYGNKCFKKMMEVWQKTIPGFYGDNE